MTQVKTDKMLSSDTWCIMSRQLGRYPLHLICIGRLRWEHVRKALHNCPPDAVLSLPAKTVMNGVHCKAWPKFFLTIKKLDFFSKLLTIHLNLPVSELQAPVGLSRLSGTGHACKVSAQGSNDLMLWTYLQHLHQLSC